MMWQTNPVLEFKKLHPDAKIPVRATAESIGLDVYSFLISETGRANSVVIPPNGVKNVPTKLAVRPQRGYCVTVFPRSGLAKEGITVMNAPGLIDPDYTGELQVLLFNGGYQNFYVGHQMRIAQLVMLPAFFPIPKVVDTFPQTERGDKGFGSTGTE